MKSGRFRTSAILLIIAAIIMLAACKPEPKIPEKILSSKRLAAKRFDILGKDSSVSFDNEGMPIGGPTSEGHWKIEKNEEYVIAYAFMEDGNILGKAEVTIDMKNEHHITVKFSKGGVDTTEECYLKVAEGPLWLHNATLKGEDGSMKFDSRGFPINNKPEVRFLIEVMEENSVTFIAMKGNIIGRYQIIRMMEGGNPLFKLVITTEIDGETTETYTETMHL